MQKVYVKFVDSTDTAIETVFSCPQDPAVWTNQGALQSNDPRYSAWYDGAKASSRVGLVTPGS